jgi:glycosyltransferase involved in cell wall biosynthesis
LILDSTLSLLIPAYNAANFLPRLLSSARAQSEPFEEILVYDDASIDNTAEVAKRYGVKVLKAGANRGCSAAKNVMARHVKTAWIHFHDADDELLPNFVTLAKKWIADSRFDVILFDYEWRENVSGELITVRRFDPEDLARDARSFAIREQINPFCGLYRREAVLRVGGYDESPEVLYNEDVAFHIRLAFGGLSLAGESEISIVNYRRENSMSSASQVKCAQAHYHVMRRALEHPAAVRYHSELAYKLWLVAGVLGSLGDWTTADAAVKLAAQLAPPPPAAGAWWFRVCAAQAPSTALRLREYAIRALRPRLRKKIESYP